MIRRFTPSALSAVPFATVARTACLPLPETGWNDTGWNAGNVETGSPPSPEALP